MPPSSGDGGHRAAGRRCSPAARCSSCCSSTQTGLVRVTEKLKAGIITATGALALFYIVTMLLSLFHVQMPLVSARSPLGIGFSLFVVGLAAFNLLLDFDFIEKAAYAGAPKYMEWYGAFGLMVTLIWLYLEILRLLSKLADRR